MPPVSEQDRVVWYGILAYPVSSPFRLVPSTGIYVPQAEERREPKVADEKEDQPLIEMMREMTEKIARHISVTRDVRDWLQGALTRCS